MSKEAIKHYEAALKEAFPRGATGEVFHHWNEARYLIATEALDKMAENAKELGLDYEPAQQCQYPECSYPCPDLPDCRDAEQPAQQQEPPTVAELLCVCGAEWEWRNRNWELVATPPAQRTWVGLTDEEVLSEAKRFALGLAFPFNGVTTPEMFARSIEAKLKEKNT